MHNHQVKMVLHIDESLGHSGRMHLIEDLERQSGVHSAHFTPHRPHLMLVDYDAATLRATDVLAQVRNGSLHAELIGI